jgi:predicted RecA/RadA family phage recombinase
VGGLIDIATSDRSSILRIFTRTDSGLIPSIGTATNNDFGIRANDLEKVRITSAGNVGIGTTSPATKLDVTGSIRASTGILFGSDTASANTLDDYEEGTFTPTLSSGFSVAPTSYTLNSGSYVKIGKVFYFVISLDPNGATANASHWKIGGLPFTTGTFSGAYVNYQVNANTNTSDMYHIPASATEILVYDVAGDARAGNAAGVDINALIAFTGFYYV